MKKYFFPFILCLSLLFPLLLPTVNSQNSSDDLETLLSQAILQYESTVDTTAFGYSPEQMDQWITQYKNSRPESFLVKEINFSISFEDTVIVTQLELDYRWNQQESQQAWQFCIKEAKSFADQARILSLPLGHILKSHELFVTNTVYDRESTNNTAYDFFKNKKGNALGMAMAYQMVCEQLGIPCRVMTSQSDGHSWNVVQLDNSYYHVDVAASDALSPFQGQIDRTHCLLSNTALSALGYSDFQQDLCTATDYDDSFWKTITSPIVYIGGYYFYIHPTEGAIFKTSFLETSGGSCLNFDESWTDASGSVLPSSYSGLYARREILYYNTPKQIMAYNPDTSELTVYSAPTLSQEEQIFDLWGYGNDTLYIRIADDETSPSDDVREISLPGAEIFTIIFRVTQTNDIIYSYKIEKGEPLYLPSIEPEIPSNNKESYRFSHWDGFVNGMKATENRVFVAVFDRIPHPTQPSAPQSSGFIPIPGSSSTVINPPSTTSPRPTQAPSSSPVTSSVPASSSVGISSSVPSSSASSSSSALTSSSIGTQINPGYSHHFPKSLMTESTPFFQKHSTRDFTTKKSPRMRALACKMKIRPGFLPYAALFLLWERSFFASWY